MEGVRHAGPADLDRLEHLLRLAVQATAADRGASLYRHPERAAPERLRLESAMDDPQSLVLAGLVDDYVVGVTLVTVDLDGPRGPLGVVEEIYVEDEARGVGVGEAMLDTAVIWCRTKNCVGVDVAALPGDRAAKNLCERSGFRARVLVMHRSL